MHRQIRRSAEIRRSGFLHRQIRRSAEIKRSGFLHTNPEECRNQAERFFAHKSGGVQKLSGAVFCTQIRRSAKIKRSGFLHKQSGGVQKLSGAVFCTSGTGEKLTINIVSNQWKNW